MEVSILVGEDRGVGIYKNRGRSGTGGEREERAGGGSSNRVGSGRNRRNYATMLNILQSKKGVRGGKVKGMQSTGGKRLGPLVHSAPYVSTTIFLHSPIHLLRMQLPQTTVEPQ